MKTGRNAQRRCAALLALVVTGSAVACKRESSRDGELAAAYAKLSSRPCALRLSQMPHRPLKDVSRAATVSTDYALAAAANQVLAHPAQHSPHRIGVAYLLAGKYSAAVNSLSLATQREPANANAWNDLAVAQYELATRADDPRLLASALAATDRSLDRGGGATAAFNRARVLDALALLAPAAAAWNRFLELDRASEWSKEARSRVAVAEKPSAIAQWQKALPELERAVADDDVATVDRLVRSFPQYARTWAESDYLSRWGDAKLARDDAGAARSLKLARVVGARLESINGEGLLLDAVRAIDASATPGDLAQAHIDYRTARQSVKSREPSAAITLLESAERRFLVTHSPMALVARYYRAGAVFDGRDATTAQQLLDSIELKPRYTALKGQVLWEQARIAGRTGVEYVALTSAQRAVEIFDKLGEREFAARNRIEVAAKLTVLGRPVEAWRARLRAFTDASATGRKETIEAALHAAARDEILDERHAEARALFRLMSESPAYSPRLRFDATLWSSFIDARSGVVRTANFAELTRAAMAVPDVLRADAEDDLRFAEALLVNASDPARALRLLDASITFQREAGRTSRVAAALVERARLQRRTGNDAAATMDLETALSLTERQTEAIHDRDLRDSFFDTAAEACRQLVEVHAEARNPSAAFMAAERCRTRSLFSETPPLPLADLQRALPTGTTLLHYTRLRERLAIIAVTSSDVSMRVVAASTFSYDTLLGPAASAIRSGNKVVIVADDKVGTVSFPALRTNSGKYLIELHEITVTPSASSWSERLSSSRSAPREALILGDPAFGATDHHSLRRLPGAAREAQKVAALYTGSTLLLGEEATATRFAALAHENDLIHIASHAFVNTRDARASALLLAGRDGQNGVFTVSEIAALRLPRSPLVVLAGCTTGNRGSARGSVSSLAAAFLAAGARDVIASLSDVDDDVTLYFSNALHTRLRAGVAPAAALRETQLEMLHSGNPRLRDPHTWGAFQLYGFE